LTVKNDPIEFNEAILGKKNLDYCKWIKDAKSWGGSIEIMILSKYYKCEICVLDIRSGRIDRFGEDCSYPSRVFIVYDGIHFDPLHWETCHGEKSTKFSTKDDNVMGRAQELCYEFQNARQFTDTANFKLRCLVCQKQLKGEKDAEDHAKKSGHINFGEIN
jgi:ubiquitin thioesterase OTU1